MQHYKGQLSTYGLSTCRKISFVALLGTRVLPPRVTIRSCLERMELKEKKERSKLTPYEYHLLINENIHFSAYAFFYTSHLCLCILEIFKVIEFLDCHNCNPLTWKLKIADSRSNNFLLKVSKLIINFSSFQKFHVQSEWRTGNTIMSAASSSTRSADGGIVYTCTASKLHTSLRIA